VDSADTPDDDRRPGTSWSSRPFLSRALRAALFAVPVLASFAVAVLLERLLPRANSTASTLLWIGIIAAGSLATLVALERAGRRLVPLAALLNIALIFPDRAPARFAVARRRGKPSELQANLQRAQDAGHTDDAQRMRGVIELVLALSVHDRASRGHSERVRVFTDLLADELKIPASGRNRLRWAALLHDIGKLEVSATILNKPSKPSPEEWAVLHRHPEEGARLVAPLLPWLGEWGRAVAQHHERVDGTGYPNRLKGNQISLAARIVAVADSYEVMTAPRPYKRPMSVSAARAELVRVAGTQLDPVIVRAFLNVSVGRLWRTIGIGAWVAQIPTLGRVFSFGGFGGMAGSGAGMGIATAAAATILAVSGVVGPGPAPVIAPGSPGQAVASAPPNVNTGGPSKPRPGTNATLPSAIGGPPAATGTPHGASPAPLRSAPGATAVPTAGSISTPRATPAPTPHPTSNPTPTATATPPPPDPWSCAACTNTSPQCTSHCSGNGSRCLTYCAGHTNPVCTSHCFGVSNPVCLTYCTGQSPMCLPPLCRAVAISEKSVRLKWTQRPNATRLLPPWFARRR
jgi:hypothetical protein